MLNKPAMTIKTNSGTIELFGNGHEIPLIQGWELTDKEKKEFDYYSESELNDAVFFRYKGNVYDIHEFMRIGKYDPCYGKFDGITSDTYFSGIVMKYCNDSESVKVYTYYCK